LAAAWQENARRDLAAAHAVILSSHPGVIDDANPGFSSWVESGYQEALALVPRVDDYEGLLAVVRFYTTGFKDGHLIYSDDKRRDEYTISVDGWRVEEQHGKIVVVQTLDNWPAPLPPIGAELVECDGKSPDSLLSDYVAPFVSRRSGPEARHRWVAFLWTRHLSGDELRRCRFRSGATELELPVVYRALTTREFFAAISGLLHDGSSAKPNSFSVLGDILWVRAVNFNMQPAQVAGFEKMLDELAQQKSFKTIVFDTRGNGGGDSGVGDRILEAATGGLDFDRTDMASLPHMYAQWRLSDVMLASARERVARETELYGAESAQAHEAARFLESTEAMQAQHKTWLDQDGGYRLTRADIVARHGKLRRFEGKVVLLTDSYCASACLDFADSIKQVPGSIQIGKTTSSDTVYIDTGRAEMPSGNHLVLPLKVWRNRLRGNDEAYQPDIVLDVDMEDDAAVQAAVLESLGFGPVADTASAPN
jgi:hypothetical protein